MFYAIPEMHTRGGIQVNAIFGVAKFLKNLSDENPDAVVMVATDIGKSFRSEIFEDYKGTRDRMPDNLRSQIDGVFSLFNALEIPVIGREWYEADDVMGSIATQYKNQDYQVVIISSDKDLCQFVEDWKVHIYDAMKRKFMREKDVIEKFGIPKNQVRDYLAIVGDSSDNIPGISGFWPKKAVDLLTKYNTLESIFEHSDDYTPKMKSQLEEQRERAFLSQKLATIVTDLSFPEMTFAQISANINNPGYVDILKEYELHSLLPKDIFSVSRPEINTQKIDDFAKISEICKFLVSKQKSIGLSVDIRKNIFFSFEDIVYEVDSNQVDVNDFIDHIFSGKILIAVYDFQKIFRDLYTIRHPNIKKNQAQETLF